MVKGVASASPSHSIARSPNRTYDTIRLTTYIVKRPYLHKPPSSVPPSPFFEHTTLSMLSSFPSPSLSLCLPARAWAARARPEFLVPSAMKCLKSFAQRDPFSSAAAPCSAACSHPVASSTRATTRGEPGGEGKAVAAQILVVCAHGGGNDPPPAVQHWPDQSHGARVMLRKRGQRVLAVGRKVSAAAVPGGCR